MQKSYHDKWRKDLEFQAGDHVFLRVTPVTGVGRTLKSKKITPHFIGPYQISEKVGNVAYRMALPPNLSNLHDVFHVSQLEKYISDPSLVIHMDDVQVRDNFMAETMPVRIEDHETKMLRGKEIDLVKVVWSGAVRESMTWESESKMRESYPELSVVKAWEESAKSNSKAQNKAQRKLSTITAWENNKKAAPEAELRKLEEQLEGKKGEYAEKMKNKIALLHKKAEEKRAVIEATKGEELLKAEEVAAKYRAT
ncbi:uncharacterized protein LOC131635178 [Vicia villosa]|uniref:uncharacterized protein LOC131635178 n=1 Tax=Vicia villosa TaxID=3911 RepID=UPI00273B62F8|nr:uncharacterized protein LOC131635178 [Vicia villosa]